MSQPVTIENDALRLDVWPTIGGKITSLVDKADGYELLISYPVELPTRCMYGLPYADAWYAGWDECFPAVTPQPYPAHPYEGIAIPDHGELWSLPTTAVPTRDGITTVWHGLRFGYRFTRKLFLVDSVVRAEYTLVNLSPFDFHFCWAQEPLFSIASPVELVFPSVVMTEGPDWPALDEGVVFDRSDRLPAGREWKRFTRTPITGPAVLRYPERQRSVTLEYSAVDVAAYWGLWINTGHWEKQHHLAVFPMTSRGDNLAVATVDKSAGCVPAMGRLEWATALHLGALV